MLASHDSAGGCAAARRLGLHIARSILHAARPRRLSGKPSRRFLDFAGAGLRCSVVGIERQGFHGFAPSAAIAFTTWDRKYDGQDR